MVAVNVTYPTLDIPLTIFSPLWTALLLSIAMHLINTL
jgi:hypothetical protein